MTTYIANHNKPESHSSKTRYSSYKSHHYGYWTQSGATLSLDGTCAPYYGWTLESHAYRNPGAGSYANGRKSCANAC